MPSPVMEGASPPAVVLPTRSNVVTNAAKAANITAIANNRITGSGFRSVLMSNSTRAAWQLSSPELSSASQRISFHLRASGRALSKYRRELAKRGVYYRFKIFVAQSGALVQICLWSWVSASTRVLPAKHHPDAGRLFNRMSLAPSAACGRFAVKIPRANCCFDVVEVNCGCEIGGGTIHRLRAPPRARLRKAANPSGKLNRRRRAADFREGASASDGCE